MREARRDSAPRLRFRLALLRRGLSDDSPPNARTVTLHIRCICCAPFPGCCISRPTQRRPTPIAPTASSKRDDFGEARHDFERAVTMPWSAKPGLAAAARRAMPPHKRRLAAVKGLSAGNMILPAKRTLIRRASGAADDDDARFRQRRAKEVVWRAGRLRR